MKKLVSALVGVEGMVSNIARDIFHAPVDSHLLTKNDQTVEMQSIKT